MKGMKGYLSAYFKDHRIRIGLAMLVGLIFNACYTVYNLVLGILYGDVWLVTVAAYYTLVAILRYLLFDYGEDVKHTAQLVSKLVLIVSAPLTGMIIYNVITSGGRSYPSATLPIFAAYALYSIVKAGASLAFSGHGGVSSVASTIRLSVALMSLFNLQTSLLSAIGVDGTFATLLNAVTGFGTAISVIALALKSGKGNDI